MTPEERIDAALDSVLKASGSALKNYSLQLHIDRMRKAMRQVMSDAYIAGSNDCFKALNKRTESKCCAGGPQWGHAWNCPTLP